MKKLFDKKVVSAFILGSILTGFISVGAVTLYMANDIGYKPNDTKWKVNDISEALDQLYKDSYTYSCETSVAEPNLGNKLIPITLADDGTVTYADTKEEWYSYCNKQWANAVILVDTPSKEYKIGETIAEADIESYFVWIPKYQYRLWNTGTPSKTAHSIEIIFTTENTIDEEGVSCATPMTSGNLGNCNNGEWMTHPAFISMDVDGFWIGKFETGYNGATSVSTSQVNSDDETKIIVKPNVYSWRYNTVYNIFVSSYEYERELNSHMIKNTEWGAVAILSHSVYGKNEEMNANNNSSYKTGYSALPGTSQQSYPGVSGDGATYNSAYNTEVGYLASTTGNITGVYDMSGGAWEYMASYRGNTLASSGFDATAIANYDTKYFDVYNASSAVTTYQYMILGDATGEMGPISTHAVGTTTAYINSWYGDGSFFIESNNPWFGRGGDYTHGVISSQFSFDRFTGANNAYSSSRLVLSP